MAIENLEKFLSGKAPSKEESEEQRLRALIREHKYGGRGREWHPNFVKYMYAIVSHPNYQGMPWSIDDKGKIRWDAPSHRPPGGKWSNLHDERLEWWKKKAVEVGIPLEGKWISKTAKEIHPFKRKPCQTCGREMSLLYEYPTKRTIEKINQIPNLVSSFDYFDFQSVIDVIPEIVNQVGGDTLGRLCEILSVPLTQIKDFDGLMSYVKRSLTQHEAKGVLSPGAMSNAPDRLDGFHTYNLCCRSKEDTGRSSENLMKYGIDRRTFEFWCDGDWAAADFLMRQKVVGNCAKCNRESELTADHVGPLSLGFCHRPQFRALCRTCNSARNNRMNYEDVKILKNDEKNGDVVVSWYARQIWDRLKDTVRNDEDALRLSKMMRANQHHYLMLLSKLADCGYTHFLEGLQNPQYALNRYELVGFSGKDFTYKKLVTVSRRQETYVRSMVQRVRRIAFDALAEYAKKGNRNAILFSDKDLFTLENSILSTLKKASVKYEEPRELLGDYMNLVADKLIEKGVPRGYWK